MRSSQVFSLAFPSSVLLLAIGSTIAAPVITELQNTSKKGSQRASLSIAAHQKHKPTGKSVIIHTDNKLDDKGAMTLLERNDDYNHMHIALNGVQDTTKAHHDAVNYFKLMEKINQAHGSNHHTKEKTFYRGGNPLNSKAPHEQFFESLPEGFSPGPLHDHKDIGEHLHKDSPSSVDIYHIAPTPHEELQRDALAAKKNNIHVGTVMHVAGYNTRQDLESRHKTSDATMQHATGMRKMFQEQHPKSETIFTQSLHTFREQGGATQDYEWAKGRFPNSALAMSTEKEPFHRIQFKATSQRLRDLGITPAKYPHEQDEKEQQKAIWAARMSKKDDKSTEHLRKQFLEPGHENLKKLREKVGKNDIDVGRLGSALHGISEDCQVELCDMNHVGALFLARKQKAGGHDSFQPLHAFRTNAGSLSFRKALPGDEHHALIPIGLDKKTVTEHLERYFPQIHRHGEEGAASSSGAGMPVP